MMELAGNGRMTFRKVAGDKPRSLLDWWRWWRRRFRLLGRQARHALWRAANAALGVARTAPQRIAERWCAWLEARRTLAELSRLDDRCLADIGFQRVRTWTGDEIIVPVLDEEATSRGMANDNARQREDAGPLRRAA